MPHICPHGAEGRVNPFHEAVCLGGLPLQEWPSILHLCFNEGWVVIVAIHSTSPPSRQGAVHPRVPKLQEACLLLLNLPTAVDQLRLSWYVMNSGTLGAPWRCPPPRAVGCSLLPALLHNRPLCQAGTRSLIAFTTIISVSQCSSSPSLTASLSEMPRLRGHGVLALTPVYAALVLPSVSAHRALGHLVGHCPYWLSGQSGKSTPWCRPRRLVRQTGAHHL